MSYHLAIAALFVLANVAAQGDEGKARTAVHLVAFQIRTSGDGLESKPLEARLDEAIKQLAAYDFGGNTDPSGTLADLAVAARNNPALRKELAMRLSAVLSGGASPGAKNLVCRQLAILGTSDQVPALATLLADEKLSHMARYALERIPGPAADEALVQSLGRVKGKLLIGIINSLGNRKSQTAVDELAKLLADTDPAVACAAAAALGKIGPAAIAVLQRALTGVPSAGQPAVVDAFLRCADTLLAEGRHEQAAAMYDRVRQGKASKACYIAATRGAILARQAAGAPILVDQLKANDKAMFGLALSLVRSRWGREFTATVTTELSNLAPQRQVQIIDALADLGDTAATPAMLRLATEGPVAVRPAAVLALGKLGNARLVPLLVKLAAGDDAELARAAMTSLATMADKEVDRALLATLENADSKARVLVIELLGQRRAAIATPALLKATAHTDEPVRRAAIKALADTAGSQDVAALVELVLRANTAGERGAAEATLGTACARMRDREATAVQLVAALAKAGMEAKAALLRSLGQVGGPKALTAVQSAFKDADPAVRDTALRVLGNWPDVAAARDLLTIAKTSDDRKHKILALRGYVRLIGQRDLPIDKKLAMCREAMPLASGPEEKKLVLGTLGGVAALDALAIVVPLLDEPLLKNEASAAAVAIGQRLAASQPAEVAKAMKKVLAVTGSQDLRGRAQEVLERTGKK